MISNPTAIRKFTKSHESSSQRSSRDSDSTPRLWHRAQVTQAQVFALNNTTSMLQRQLDRLRRRKPQAPPGASVPFQIRRSSTWLKFQVGDGRVITTGEPIEPTNIDTDITITAGVEFYWIYLAITTTTAAVTSSASTPAWAISLVPIGWVDTLTNEADEVSTIYQFIHDNVYIPCTL